jgi:hypothetical protein
MKPVAPLNLEATIGNNDSRWLFIAVGALGFAYHVREIGPGTSIEAEVVWVLALRIAAILGGAFLLRGARWSRWLLIGWMTYHVILGAFHSAQQLVVHVIILAVITPLLYRSGSNEYFRRTS